MSKENPISFPLGKIVATHGIAQFLEQPEIVGLVRRHAANDWGDLCDEDKEANESALKHGERVLSCYEVKEHKVYVITEADRSVSTVLLSDEY